MPVSTDLGNSGGSSYLNFLVGETQSLLCELIEHVVEGILNTAQTSNTIIIFCIDRKPVNFFSCKQSDTQFVIKFL